MKKIAIIGQGYVGLPLAIEFGKLRPVIGYDSNKNRIQELKENYDSNHEISKKEFDNAVNLKFSLDENELTECDIYIVTVPTPINKSNHPDLTPLKEATKMLGSHIKFGDIIIFESTVYPGVTEEECLPVLEKFSGLKFNKDFYLGYSPERINPGDKINTLDKIIKITSGSTPEIANEVDNLYRSIIKAGTFKASSIKIAEAAKVIENVQRDVNIALVNELYQIFTKLNIDTNEVIEAASTKWNFMKLFPGMVGGHCISVDPYYLLHKSKESGYIPDLMQTARQINNNMPDFIANNFLQKLIAGGINPQNLKVAMLGFAFKENCSDIRNTKAFELFSHLKKLGMDVTVYDPHVDVQEVRDNFEIHIEPLSKVNEKIAIVAVGHSEILELCENRKFEFIYDFRGRVK
tara:strand:+ start:3419 stop:4636 length:1218 start_codon:yes stop_codon:yes gene_type:complete